MAVKISEDLLEPIGLAQDIYSCWRELMVTDQVPGLEKWPTWLTLSPDWRNAFVEAVRMQVTDHLCRTADALEREAAIDEAFASNQTVKRRCYVCNDVHDFSANYKGVALCNDCRRVKHG